MKQSKGKDEKVNLGHPQGWCVINLLFLPHARKDHKYPSVMHKLQVQPQDFGIQFEP
jgi:hypothetical protein